MKKGDGGPVKLQLKVRAFGHFECVAQQTKACDIGQSVHTGHFGKR